MSPPINARVTGWPPENWITSRFLIPYFSKKRPSLAAQSGAWVALKIVPARSGSWALSQPGKKRSRSAKPKFLAIPCLPTGDCVVTALIRLSSRAKARDLRFLPAVEMTPELKRDDIFGIGTQSRGRGKLERSRIRFLRESP